MADQDMSVFDILESIFKDYQGQGKLVPAWRLEIADLSAYPKRSLTTQYQESDLAFVQRLMSEEGLFSWLEHLGDPASVSLGSHTLVIADNNAAFKPNAQASINFTQPGAVMKSDSMDRWRSERRWQTTAVEVASWDYRSINNRPVVAHSSANNSSDSSSLVSQDAPGAYSYESRALGQRLADLQLQAVEVQNKIFTGAGTVRTLSPGTRFSLLGQAGHDLLGGADESNFVVLRVVHQAHNNLSADLHAQLAQALGHLDVSKSLGGLGALGKLSELIGGDNLHATGKDQGERPLYRNRIDAIRSTIPYRSLRSDQHGQLLHPKPAVAGQQSAIVVGPAGNVIYTDRDHRIKLQFHWKRGTASNNAHSRL
ncbi:MAG: type VI secretion system Vgr family protein, partial [Burkholderiales bacterium]|nr:type VI secretion system Vgr family protein [Burkholderiales bacterium]